MKAPRWLGLCLLLAGCNNTNNNDCVLSDGGAGGTDHGSGAGGSGTNEIRPLSKMGFGQDGGPCDENTALAIRATADDVPDIAAKTFLFDAPGTITRVVTVHAVGNSGVCGAAPRSVLVTEPGSAAVPKIPLIHEKLMFSTADIEAAVPYAMLGVDEAALVVLKKDLAEPLHVEAGEYVHVGNLLDDTTICVASCSALLDGNDPPAGDIRCNQGNWTGCVAMPSELTNNVAFIGWIEFLPDQEAP